MTQEQQDLIADGQRLVDWVKKHPIDHFSDYSFLVAPFAKAYEGFLKVFFLSKNFIDEKNYYSDRFRVGKVLNPSLKRKVWSVYRKLELQGETGEKLAEKLWEAWRLGRNQIFHYFPHNLNRLTFAEAEERINAILSAIQETELVG